MKHRFKLNKLCLALSLLLLLFSNGNTGGASEKAEYQNDLVIRSERLEQEEQQNSSKTSRLRTLFETSDTEKLQALQQKNQKEREMAIDQLFQESAPKVEQLDKNALFKRIDTKIVYSQPQSSQEQKRFTIVFYSILALVILGSLVYMSYLFLKG
ncbi:type VII secretion protein EssA [Streptococcus rifensis]